MSQVISPKTWDRVRRTVLRSEAATPGGRRQPLGQAQQVPLVVTITKQLTGIGKYEGRATPACMYPSLNKSNPIEADDWPDSQESFDCVVLNPAESGQGAGDGTAVSGAEHALPVGGIFVGHQISIYTQHDEGLSFDFPYKYVMVAPAGIVRLRINEDGDGLDGLIGGKWVSQIEIDTCSSDEESGGGDPDPSTTGGSNQGGFGS